MFFFIEKLFVFCFETIQSQFSLTFFDKYFVIFFEKYLTVARVVLTSHFRQGVFVGRRSGVILQIISGAGEKSI